MQHHSSDIKKALPSQLGIEELDDLNSRRSDILPKMSGMIKRKATIEVNNTVCHVCGSRFSMRFEVEAKGRTEDASVFRINMECKHCQWNAVFYGYIHKDGRNGIDTQHLSADRFFAERQ